MGSDGAVIQLVTRCSSEQEFIDRFARFTSETDVVVPALPHVHVGTAGQFVIFLKDRSVVMQGRCEVTEIRSMAVEAGGAAAPPARALMRLRLHEMDAHSAGIHLRLMERRAPAPVPPAAPASPRRTPARALSLVPPVPATPTPEGAPRPAASVAPVAPPKPAPPPSTMQVMTIPRPPPLRSVPAPLPGMVPAPTAALGSAGAVVVAAASPAQSEPTVVSPTPSPEARAPGAAFTLPANPLSDLDASDLASFIELTLLETKAAVQAAPIANSGRVAASVPAVDAQVTTDPVRAAPAASPLRARVNLDQVRSVALRVAPYAACLTVGLVFGFALRPSAKVAVMVGTPSVVTPPPPVVAPPPPVAVAPAPPVQTPTTRDCVARITTTPKGAAVLWGDLTLGPTPIDRAAVPCGSATVTFRRERYAEATRTIAVERGQNSVVTERLYRPPARLVVTSSPPNALIKMNKHRFGAAPRKINTMRFEHVRIEASLPGYQPWKKTVYLKDAEPRVDITLVPVAKPSARRAAAQPAVRTAAPAATPIAAPARPR